MREDSRQFKSKALEVNLLETNRPPIDLSEREKWFISLSKTFLGINERTASFFTELQHPYPNYSWIVDNFRTLCLGDFWFYLKLPESEEAFCFMAESFERLFSKSVSEEKKISLFQTLMQFLKELLKLENPPVRAISQLLALIKKLIDTELSVVLNGANFFHHMSVLPEQNDEINGELFHILEKIIESGLNYWSITANCSEWVGERTHLFPSLDMADLEKQIGKDFFLSIQRGLENSESWEDLTTIPLHRDIADRYRQYTENFKTPLEQIYFLYYLLYTPGMSHLKDHLLWDMNRLLRRAFQSLQESDQADFVDSIFNLLETFKENHMATLLDCIETLGTEIARSGIRDLIQSFTDRLISFGFVYPGEVEILSDWRVVSNPDHLKNIRVWLAIIEENPEAMKELMAALIVHLRIGGLFIQDTDLFQKDMSQLLNAKIGGIYKLIKHFAILFPIYYSEIGAEGELREETTRIDEINGRRDLVIHFLRKQVHAESNSTHVELIRQIIEYWYSGDPEALSRLLPRDVQDYLLSESESFHSVHQVMKELCTKAGKEPCELLEGSEAELNYFLDNLESGSSNDRDRVRSLFRLTWMLVDKYFIDSRDILKQIRKNPHIDTRWIDQLEKHLQQENRDTSLKMIFKIMETLKQIILDPAPSESWEDIYYKRHIAAGIPSMYGRYHEQKYEALGLTLRLEKTAEQLLENIIQEVNLNYITYKSLKRITVILGYFRTGLQIRGIYNQSFESNIYMLEYSLASESFSLEQYINIFQFFIRNIREIIDQYFISVYDKPLKLTLKQKYQNKLPEHKIPKKLAQDSETFYRDILASSFFVQTLDNFVGTILQYLRETRDKIPAHLLHKVMTYDSDLILNPLYKKKRKTDNKVFLGSKAFFLKKLISLDFPIPEGFVLTTELFRHKEIIQHHPEMEKDVDNLVLHELENLETITGLEFGSSESPLLLSVRSGSAFSMPGAMQTFLNVGINRQIACSLSRNPLYAWAAWDSYRRLLQTWGMSFGIKRDDFDSIMQQMKSQYGVVKKRSFSPEQMMELADAYHHLLEKYKIDFVNDPFQQLKTAILAVLNSWSSKRAKLYREHLKIADEWGTAVLIQRMIFGNLNQESGTGVVFTKNPYSDDKVRLYGDYIPCSQGEDVVSGLVHTLPITASSAPDSHQISDPKSKSLEEEFPIIFEKLKLYAARLIENHDFPHQEIEFTYESPEKLFILQARPQVFSKAKNIQVFETKQTNPRPVGRGIGVGGGALNGIVVFDMQDIQKFRRQQPEKNCILLRPDTVPDDIEMVFACDGLLTSRGGTTSHAAVTAAQLGTVCVVNCQDLSVNEKEKTAVIHKHIFKPGDKIAIDGTNGGIYKGNFTVCTQAGDIFS